MHMLWSAKNNVFIPAQMRQQYEAAGWDLSDCTKASNELAAEFMGLAPLGKMRIAGGNGMPQWGDIPANPTEQEHQAS